MHGLEANDHFCYYSPELPHFKDKNMQKRNVIIIGAAGRNFHNFNIFYRDNPNYIDDVLEGFIRKIK